jgi:trimeric autotransporter adhesin
MSLLIQLKKALPVFLLAIPCFALLPKVHAVVPPPDGGYPNFNTAEGTFALLNLTTGSGNTALGGRALQNNTVTSYNTAVGYGTLFSNQGNTASLNTAVGFDALFGNVFGGFNTATGARALYSNTAGNYNTADGFGALFSNIGGGCNIVDCGSRNTAVGVVALFSNRDGFRNTAVGTNALFRNISGEGNTAVGDSALLNNDWSFNTAIGLEAMFQNRGGVGNTAVGVWALHQNTDGSSNTAVGAYALNGGGEEDTAIGVDALYNNSGKANTAVGVGALAGNTSGGSNTAIGHNAVEGNSTGNWNIGLGQDAGLNLTTGDWNIDIGNAGVGGDANTIRLGTPFDPGSGTGHHTVFVAGIAGTTLDNGVPVVVDTSTGQLGVLPSSQRFKAEIKPMDKVSEAILALKPVTFCYKSMKVGRPQFGLVAEEVAKVTQDLVVPDKEGKPYTVRYDAVNAMLLNEFLKEHHKVEQLTKDFQSKLTEQQKQIEALTAGLQKVIAELELSKPGLHPIVNNP